jgi:hypothetical protein
MDSKQSWHTGKRETFTSGALHRRQLEGKTTLKSPSAASARTEATTDPRSDSGTFFAALGSPLLLKTSLLDAHD